MQPGKWELQTHDYIAHGEVTNERPKPFVWTKTADEILTLVARFRQRAWASHH